MSVNVDTEIWRPEEEGGMICGDPGAVGAPRCWTPDELRLGCEHGVTSDISHSRCRRDYWQAIKFQRNMLAKQSRRELTDYDCHGIVSRMCNILYDIIVVFLKHSIGL